jgi:6-phosphofructokinase 1
VIRAVTRRSLDRGSEVIGVREGWRGMTDRLFHPLDYRAISGLLPRGGTILGTSRTNPYKSEDGVQRVLETTEAESFDALVAVGGEDTLGVAARLHAEHAFPVVGVPKTIDNDLSGTDYTFGFWTAVQIAADAIDRLHTTGESHDRVIVVEVMGRHAGWIALESGLAGGAHAILIPEQRPPVEAVCARIRGRRERGRGYAIVVVSEGVELGDDGDEGTVDEFGHRQLAKAGVAEVLAERIAAETGAEARPVVLGHVQRGGTPIAFDRALATRYGMRAAELVAEGGFGRMAALRGDRVVDVALDDAVSELKTVPERVWRRVAEVVSGP